jgi:Domain of unknown function (DUF932)
MTETSTLITHNPKFKCEMATREQLGQYATPPATASWKPVPHFDLVTVLSDVLNKNGLEITREQFAVGRKGLALFGVMELRGMFTNVARSMALGFRHSNDKSVALRMVAGTRVFVCDNLALSGDPVTFRKHTSLLDLFRVMKNGIGRYLDAFRSFNTQIARCEQTRISDDQAKVKLVDLWRADALPISLFSQAHDNYFKAEELQYEDSAPRTAWGLHNACTRAMKALAPTSQFPHLTALGREFGLA